MENFNELNLPQMLLASLEKMNFNTPTPIQAKAIPFALEGRDILGSAQTGTGKTAAFGIPMVAHLLNNSEACAIVMTPTRELATQVGAAIRQMIDRESGIKMALLIGGESMGKQFDQLRQGARIIVGTPGRINDHLSRGSLKLMNTNFLVLDETDRMLDMGFGVQIDKILRYMPKQRQTLMFSATLPHHIVKMSDQYMNNPERVAAGSVSTPIEAIKQDLVRTPTALKYEALTKELDARTGSIIVFVKTKHGADRLAAKLERENHSADAIHGDLRQNKRDKVIRNFREKKNRILVATDVAARGLDIPHIEHVINYDLPQCPEDYIHRIGRTARAGATGSAVCILTPEDGAKWNAILRLIDPSAKIERTEGASGPRQGRGRSGGGRSNGGPRNDRYKSKRFEGGRSEGRSEGGFKKPYKKFEKFDRPAKFDRAERSEKPWSNRSDRPARAEGTDRFERSEKPARSFDRADKPARSFDRSDRPARNDRFERSDRPNSGERTYKPKFERSDRNDRSDKRDFKPRGERSDQKSEGGFKKPYKKFERSEGGGNSRFHSARDNNRSDRPQRSEGRPEGRFERPERNDRSDARPARFERDGQRPERGGFGQQRPDNNGARRNGKPKERHQKRPKPFEFKKHDRKKKDGAEFASREPKFDKAVGE